MKGAEAVANVNSKHTTDSIMIMLSHNMQTNVVFYFVYRIQESGLYEQIPGFCAYK